jgi:3-oxoacyl-[acyl-carrier protein] reductase
VTRYRGRFAIRILTSLKENVMSKLNDKVALVTGGSRGIGAAIAKRLAAEGATVAITYRKGKDAAAALVKAIENEGGRALAIQADAADAGAVKGAVEQTFKTFGRLDVLVNNAGTCIPEPVVETSLENFDRVFAINVRGMFVATQAALKHMKSGARIINIGSCVGESIGFGGMAPYAATKGAVKMFTQGLARELGALGVTVNNVEPGPIDTDLNPANGEWAVGQKALVPLGRYGRPEEIAAMVAFIASPESAYVNGANLKVDGGMTV